MDRKTVIDSRDLIERSKEIESEIEDLESDREQLRDELSDTDLPEDAERLRAELSGIEDEIKDLREEQGEIEALGEDVSEWEDGATLIHEDYFEEYAQELAEDIGAIDRNASWPLTCIDWKEAAEQLAQDYTHVDYDGETYLVRSY